jgi:ribosomal protein L18E
MPFGNADKEKGQEEESAGEGGFHETDVRVNFFRGFGKKFTFLSGLFLSRERKSYQLRQVNQPKPYMKKLFAILSIVALSGSIYAGCGVKVPVSGELSAYDAEKKVLKVGSEEITLAAAAKIVDADGKEVKIEDLVGKKVTVSTDKHTKKGEEVKADKA